MATLVDYVKGLREQQKPQPAPDEETIEQAEAYDIITGGAEDETD